ncbi:uncharacterized protein LOC143604204 [Bidens hawaiensis]|uniref:uncharacterized protein LOC143604204 n=1 Tax=Bidens hawaiensis TaxID=980011 RepID=UPI004049A107
MADLNEHATIVGCQNFVDVYKGISSEYVDHGNQSVMCPSCNALLWKTKVNRPSSSNEEGAFSLCCYNGKVELPDVRQPYETYLDLFRGESAMSKYLLKNIRRFNSMFSFTSMGGKTDHSINRGNAPYTFRLSGENNHCLGSLLPLDGRKPQFSQLYIYNTKNEIQTVNVDNISKVNEQEKHIINYLKTMLDSNNHLVQAYRMVRDCFEENPQLDFKLRIIGTRQHDARQYNLPSSSEVAALIVGDIGDAMVCYPDFFITITFNPNWPKVKRFLKDTTLKLEDRPDILCQLYKLKLDAMIKLVKDKSLFGRVQVVVYTIQFQKRGSTTRPYLHIFAFRYVSGCEAAWRIFAFDVHYRLPFVMRLAFHLPGEQQVIYGANKDIEDILNKKTNVSSMFTGWFECNKNYDLAKSLTYSEFPAKFVWKKQLRKWEPRLRGFAIGRVHVVPLAFDDILTVFIVWAPLIDLGCFWEFSVTVLVFSVNFQDSRAFASI